VVTGGSSGIGQGIAVRLAQEGADVAFNFHSNPEGAAETTRQIEAAGLRAFAIKANLDSRESACALIAECAAHFTTLDLLLNNAGLEKKSPFLEVSEADYDHVLAVNLKGVFFATQAFAQHCIDHKAPWKVINISSVHEELPFPNFAPYCLSTAIRWKSSTPCSAAIFRKAIAGGVTITMPTDKRMTAKLTMARASDARGPSSPASAVTTSWLPGAMHCLSSPRSKKWQTKAG